MRTNKPEKGQGIIEYVLIVVLLIVTGLVIAALFGPAVANFVASFIPEFASLPRDTQITVAEVAIGSTAVFIILGLFFALALGDTRNQS